MLAGERQKRESQRAIIACNDYLRLGPSRSFSKLIAKYAAEQNTATTQKRPTLEHWSYRFGWVARAEIYDARIEAERQARHEELLQTGLALAPERIARLTELFEMLWGELNEQSPGGALHNLWLPDVKVAGGEAIEIERYNSPIIGDIRGLLDDLAKEVGGRRSNVDVTSGGQPLPILGFEVVPPADEPSPNGHEEEDAE